MATLLTGIVGLGEGMAAVGAAAVAVQSSSGTVAVGSSTVTLRWAWASHPGGVRQVNEDSVVAEAGLFAVCDGMGGHRGGQRASTLAVDDLVGIAPGSAPHGVRDVVAVLRHANDHVLIEGNANPELLGMGTTAVLLALVDNGGKSAFVAANVGDSRIYQRAGGTVTQISTDHSVIQELLDAGAITLDDVPTHRDRHVVTRVLGSDPPPEVDIWIFEPTAGERFLLCSDGVHGEIDEAQIREALGLLAPTDAVQALATAAFAAGARDNLSAVVIDVVDRVDDNSMASDDTVPREQLPRAAEPPAQPQVTNEQTAGSVVGGRSGDAVAQPSIDEVPRA